MITGEDEPDHVLQVLQGTGAVCTVRDFCGEVVVQELETDLPTILKVRNQLDQRILELDMAWAKVDRMV